MRMPTKKTMNSVPFWMKTTAGGLAAGATAIALTGTLLAGPLVLTGYDFDRINSNIAAATKSVIADSSVIESAVATIDGAVTNLDKDIYKLDKMLVLKKAPWTKDKVEAALSIIANVNRSDKPEKGSLGLNVNLALKTDTLAFLKLMNQKKIQRCASFKESGVKSISFKHRCGLAADVAKATDLKEVSELIQSHTTGEIKDLESFIASSKATLESQSSVLLKDEGRKLLEKTERKLHALKSIKVDPTAEGFTLAMDHAPSRHQGCKIKHLEMVLNPDSASLKADISMRFSTMVYDAMKPEIANVLKGLEDGREFAMEHVASHARFHERLMAAMFAKASQEIGQSSPEAGQESGQESGLGQSGMQLPINVIEINDFNELSDLSL